MSGTSEFSKPEKVEVEMMGDYLREEPGSKVYTRSAGWKTYLQRIYRGTVAFPSPEYYW